MAARWATHTDPQILRILLNSSKFRRRYHRENYTRSAENSMIKLARILRDYGETGALNALVNVHVALDDGLFLTKSGDLISFLAFHGPDYECLDASQLDAVARRFESALRLFDSKFRLYQYLLKSDHPAISCAKSGNPVLQKALDARAAYFAAKGNALYNLDTFAAVVYRPESAVDNWSAQMRRLLKEPKLTARQLLSMRGRTALIGAELGRAQEILRGKVASFAVQLRDDVKVDILDHEEGFRFLRRL